MRPHVVGVHGAADHASQHLRNSLAAEDVQPAVLQVAQPGGEPEAEQGQQAEHLVGGASGVGEVLDDAQPRAVLEQPVQHVRRLGRGRRDDLGVERSELVRDMGVERDPGLVAVPGIDVAQRLAAAARAEELPVRAGGGAVAPDPGQRQCPVSLDQAG